MMTFDEATKRLAKIETEAATIREFLTNYPKRAPRKIPYSCEELVNYIYNETLPEPLIVGDYMDITMYHGVPIRLTCAGIKHDTTAAGNIADYSFIVTGYNASHRMNKTADNDYKNCEMRTVTLPQILKLLPPVLAEGIVPVKKPTSAGHGKKEIIQTIECLFLLSEIEFYGKASCSVSGEGTQYELCKNADFRRSVAQNHEYPSLRSPYYGNSHNFCYVYSNGDSSYNIANSTHGVVFGFCLSSKNRS